MTLVRRLPEGDLYYYDYLLDIWVVVGPQSLLVAYCDWESLEQISDLVSKWHRHLHGDTALELTHLDLRPPEYLAWNEPTTGNLKIVHVKPGDWMGIPGHPLPARRDLLPRYWPEEYRAEIQALQRERTVPRRVRSVKRGGGRSQRERST